MVRRYSYIHLGRGRNSRIKYTIWWNKTTADNDSRATNFQMETPTRFLPGHRASKQPLSQNSLTVCSFFSQVFKAGTAPTADRFYFSVVSNRRRCINRGTSSLHACVAFKTLLPIGSYIRADKQGHVTLRYQSPMYRSTWFWLESCSRISWHKSSAKLNVHPSCKV